MATRDAPGMGGSNWKTADTGDDSAGDHHGSAVDHHGSAVDHQGTGRRALDAVQDRIRTAFDQQTHRAADQLSGVASALNRAAQDISRENDGPVIRSAEQAAGRIHAVADILRRSSMDEVVGEVEGFARRQPELFLGGVFAAGFLFARFLKSSSGRRTSPVSPASASTFASHAGPVGTATPATGTPVNGGPVMRGPAADTPRPGSGPVP